MKKINYEEIFVKIFILLLIIAFVVAFISISTIMDLNSIYPIFMLYLLPVILGMLITFGINRLCDKKELFSLINFMILLFFTGVVFFFIYNIMYMVSI